MRNEQYLPVQISSWLQLSAVLPSYKSPGHPWGRTQFLGSQLVASKKERTLKKDGLYHSI